MLVALSQTDTGTIGRVSLVNIPIARRRTPAKIVVSSFLFIKLNPILTAGGRQIKPPNRFEIDSLRYPLL